MIIEISLLYPRPERSREHRRSGFQLGREDIRDLILLSLFRRKLNLAQREVLYASHLHRLADVPEPWSRQLVRGGPQWVSQALMVPSFALLALAGFYMAWHHLQTAVRAREAAR